MRFNNTNIKNLVMVSLASLAVSVVSVRAAFNPPGQAPPLGNVDVPVYSVGTSQTLSGGLSVSSGGFTSTVASGTAIQGTGTIGVQGGSGGTTAVYGVQSSGSNLNAIYGNASSGNYAGRFEGIVNINSLLELSAGAGQGIRFIYQDTGIIWPDNLGADLFGVYVKNSNDALRLVGHGGGVEVTDKSLNVRLTVSEAGVVNVASGGSLQVNGVNVCLSNGTNCPAATTPTLQTVTNAGNTTTQAITVATLNTGQGAYELYAMNQNVQTTDSPTFAALTVTTLNTGQGAYELYAMNQNVRTSDTPTFTGLSANSTRVTSVATPTTGTDAANKSYVDAAVAAAGGGSNIEVKNCGASADQTATCSAYCSPGYEIVDHAIT